MTDQEWEAPPWLREALFRYRAAQRPAPTEHEVRRGDIRVMTSTEEGPEPYVSRIVLVTEVQDNAVHGHLCSNEVDMATELDLVLEQGEATPYALLVQGELYLTAYHSQVGALVGELKDEEKIKAIEDAWWSEGRSLDKYWTNQLRPPHLQGRTDPRWKFKEQELQEGVMPIRNAWLCDQLD